MIERSAQTPPSLPHPHLVDPSGVLGGYWTDPPGAIVRFIHPARGTAELAQWLASEGLALLLARFPGDEDLRVVLDMREMIGRSAVARSVIMEASKTAVRRIKHVVLLPSVHMGAAYISVIEASAMALRLLGYRVDIEHDLEHALGKHGIRLQPSSEIRAVLAPQPAKPARTSAIDAAKRGC